MIKHRIRDVKTDQDWLEKNTEFVEGISVVERGKLEAQLAHQGRLTKWKAWFAGQTGIIKEGKLYVFTSDISRFLRDKSAMIF